MVNITSMGRFREHLTGNHPIIPSEIWGCSWISNKQMKYYDLLAIINSNKNSGQLLLSNNYNGQEMEWYWSKQPWRMNTIINSKSIVTYATIYTKERLKNHGANVIIAVVTQNSYNLTTLGMIMVVDENQNMMVCLCRVTSSHLVSRL